MLKGTRRLSRRARVILLASALLLAVAITFIGLQFVIPECYFSAHRFVSDNITIPYQFLPPERVTPGQQYPLVVFLHGSSEVGLDNRGPLAWVGGFFLNPHNRQAYPCYVLVPQCPPNYDWAGNNVVGDTCRVYDAESESLRLTFALIQNLQRQYPIDSRRIYLIGFSMGASGVWELIGRHPGVFAAAAPVAGYTSPWSAARLRHTPVWVFHGAWDSRVPVSESREMVAAMRQAGCTVKYTEYPHSPHWCLLQVLHEKDLLPWMFAQRRQ